MATGAAARELETLAQLASGLDDQFTVYHGAHWTRVERSNFAIIGEIDFETLDDAAVRRLFVGATRATMKLTLVVSEKSARVLLDRMA